MNIGLDYDDTYTRDPKMWTAICMLMQTSGHQVYLVSWRTPQESNQEIRNLAAFLDGAYFTSRKAKEKYMYDQGIRIDILIDNNPHAIFNTMEGWY